jgi:hypothetical protein
LEDFDSLMGALPLWGVLLEDPLQHGSGGGVGCAATSGADLFALVAKPIFDLLVNTSALARQKGEKNRSTHTSSGLDGDAECGQLFGRQRLLVLVGWQR